MVTRSSEIDGWQPKTLVVVGVGLIGGSIGLSARRGETVPRIIGVDPDQPSLERARSIGAIDEATTDLAAAATQADVMVVCTPVDRIASQLRSAIPHCRPGTLLTDVGSTKASIVAAVEPAIVPGIRFVGAHPLAGAEKRGVEHSRAGLFDGRVTILTPTERTPAADLEVARRFWQSLRSEIRILDPLEHDRILSLTSHLPHLVAAALVGLLDPSLFDFAAGGLRDTTRIAAGDPHLWSAIFSDNRRAILLALKRLRTKLDEFEDALANDNRQQLDRLLTQAKRVRDDLGS
jgi:prephenate dehydrogenase